MTSSNPKPPTQHWRRDAGKNRLGASFLALSALGGVCVSPSAAEPLQADPQTASSAQSSPTPAPALPANLSLLSVGAGYKAAFTCSAYFNAGRGPEKSAGDELNRIYPDYREVMAGLPDAVIDEKARTVAVPYAEGLPPRIAAWRPFLGCAQLPTNGTVDGVENLPRITGLKPPAPAAPLAEKLSNSVAVSNVAAAAFDRRTYGEGTETTAILVVKDGAVIAEQYREGFGPTTPQRTWSVAKSIAGSIIGAAVHAGKITTDEPAALDVWATENDPRMAITIDDLLRMASGLTSPTAGNRTDDVYFGGGRVIDHAITNRLVAPPGGLWRYANNDTMTAIRALRERMKNDQAFLRFPFEALLHPLGMHNTYLETDWNGDFILSSQVWTTARDMARLGLLYLNDGVWEGKRLLPKGWASYVAAPDGPQPGPGRSGATPPGYGAQFWLYNERHGLPDGVYAARGNRGQYLFIVPSQNTLVIRRGFDDNGGARFDMVGFTADMLAAISDE